MLLSAHVRFADHTAIMLVVPSEHGACDLIHAVQKPMFKPQYQLVVQVKSVRSEDLNWLVQWENDISTQLGPSVDVDGHDFGSGEFNIFILTSDPTASFRKVQEFVAMRPLPTRWPLPTGRSTAMSTLFFGLLTYRGFQLPSESRGSIRMDYRQYGSNGVGPKSGRRWRIELPRCWPPSAAQTARAVFPHAAFTKAHPSEMQSRY